MEKKEIEKFYNKKINKLRKHDEAYFLHDKPIISMYEDSDKFDYLVA